MKSPNCTKDTYTNHVFLIRIIYTLLEFFDRIKLVGKLSKSTLFEIPEGIEFMLSKGDVAKSTLWGLKEGVDATINYF